MRWCVMARRAVVAAGAAALCMVVGCSGEAEVLVPYAGGEDMAAPVRDMAADLGGRADMARGDLGRLGQDSPDMPDAPDQGAAGADMGVADMGAAVPDMGPPAPQRLRVAILSDLNGSYGSTTYGPLVHDAAAWLADVVKPDVVLTTGDMVAGQRAGLDYDAMWSAFHAAVTDPLTRAGVPLAPTPGNHDASGYASFVDEREVYVSQWQAHRPNVTFVEDTFYPLRYAFRMGPALFVSLDDTVIAPLDDMQRMWLRQVLTANADAPVKIVYGHVPLYAVAQGREDEALEDEALEAMLVELGVDAFISGHHHAYYPGKRGPLRLISMPCLGSGSRKLIGEDVVSPRGVTLVDVEGDRLSSVELHVGDGFASTVPRASLPPLVSYHDYTIVRDDL